MNFTSLYTAFPEISLAVFAMLMLIYGVVRGERSAQTVGIASFVAVLSIMIFVLKLGFIYSPGFPKLHISAGCYGCYAFDYMFIDDAFARFVKVILLCGSALSIILSWTYLKKENLSHPEYPILILFATLGMLLMVSANDLLALYVGLELQSLSLYVLAAYNRDNAKSSESGLKYFVLGALSSGLLLYGISLIYGYTGVTKFTSLSKLFIDMHQPPIGVLFGLVFICAGLAFKVSAVPFHMWTPDVYEGAPTPVTAFFAAAPKVAALAVLARLLIVPFGSLAHQWGQIIVFISVASMLLGSFAGLVQSSIKRLMAYSSIANVGYALVGIIVGGTAGMQALLIYVAIYFINTLGVFAVILSLRRKGKSLDRIVDFSGLAKTNPLLALTMVIFMFSLAGVPPLAGFFGKYFIFLAAVKAGMMPLAIIGVLTSVVSAYYYLRIIKLMYFDDGINIFDPLPEFGLRIVLAISALYMIVFTIWPAPIIDQALIAAHSLTGG